MITKILLKYGKIFQAKSQKDLDKQVEKFLNSKNTPKAKLKAEPKPELQTVTENTK